MPPTFNIAIQKVRVAQATNRPTFSKTPGVSRFVPAFFIQPADAKNRTGAHVPDATISYATSEQGGIGHFEFSIDGLDPEDVRLMVEHGIIRVQAGYDNNDGPPVSTVFYGHITEASFKKISPKVGKRKAKKGTAATTSKHLGPGQTRWSFTCLAGSAKLYGSEVHLGNPNILISEAIGLVARTAGLLVGVVPKAAGGDFSGIPIAKGAVLDVGKSDSFALSQVHLEGMVVDVLNALAGEIRRAIRDATGTDRNITLAPSTDDPYVIDIIDNDAPPRERKQQATVDVDSPGCISAGGTIYTAPKAPVAVPTDGADADSTGGVDESFSDTATKDEFDLVTVFDSRIRLGLVGKAEDEDLGDSFFRVQRVKHDLTKWRTEWGGPVIKTDLKLSPLAELEYNAPPFIPPPPPPPGFGG